MADRHAVASGEDEKRHDENTMKDIHFGKRGSETANVEQLDTWRSIVRFEQDAPNAGGSRCYVVFGNKKREGRVVRRAQKLRLKLGYCGNVTFHGGRFDTLLHVEPRHEHGC